MIPPSAPSASKVPAQTLATRVAQPGSPGETGGFTQVLETAAGATKGSNAASDAPAPGAVPAAAARTASAQTAPADGKILPPAGAALPSDQTSPDLPSPNLQSPARDSANPTSIAAWIGLSPRHEGPVDDPLARAGAERGSAAPSDAPLTPSERSELAQSGAEAGPAEPSAGDTQVASLPPLSPAWLALIPASLHPRTTVQGTGQTTRSTAYAPLSSAAPVPAAPTGAGIALVLEPESGQPAPVPAPAERGSAARSADSPSPAPQASTRAEGQAETEAASALTLRAVQESGVPIHRALTGRLALDASIAPTSRSGSSGTPPGFPAAATATSAATTLEPPSEAGTLGNPARHAATLRPATMPPSAAASTAPSSPTPPSPAPARATDAPLAPLPKDTGERSAASGDKAPTEGASAASVSSAAASAAAAPAPTAAPSPAPIPATLAGGVQDLAARQDPASQTSGSAPNPAERPQDFSTLVERLHAARQGQGDAVVKTTLAHAQFGTVSLHMRPDATGMNVALRSADPDLAASVQTAAAALLAAPPAAATPGDPARDSAGHPQQGTPSSPSNGTDPNGQSPSQRGAQGFAQGLEQGPGNAGPDQRPDRPASDPQRDGSDPGPARTADSLSAPRAASRPDGIYA